MGRVLHVLQVDTVPVFFQQLVIHVHQEPMLDHLEVLQYVMHVQLVILAHHL